MVEGVSASEFFGVLADVEVVGVGVTVEFSGVDAVVLVGAVAREAVASVLSLRPSKRSSSFFRKLSCAVLEDSVLEDSTE